MTRRNRYSEDYDRYADGEEPEPTEDELLDREYDDAGHADPSPDDVYDQALRAAQVELLAGRIDCLGYLVAGAVARTEYVNATLPLEE